MSSNNIPTDATIDFYACLTKNKSSSELREAIQTCKNKINKNSLSFKVFPGSQPGKYYPPPTDFDLESRPSSFFFSGGMLVNKRRS